MGPKKQIAAGAPAHHQVEKIVSAYGRTGEDDVVKPRSPERNPRENARSSMTVEQTTQSQTAVGWEQTEFLNHEWTQMHANKIPQRVHSVA
jgi:hypothetical protein